MASIGELMHKIQVLKELKDSTKDMYVYDMCKIEIEKLEEELHVSRIQQARIIVAKKLYDKGLN
jgi:hypothetical protein